MTLVVVVSFAVGVLGGEAHDPGAGRYRIVEPCNVFDIRPYGAFELTAHLPQVAPKRSLYRYPGDIARRATCTHLYTDSEGRSEVLDIAVVVGDTETVNNAFEHGLMRLSEATAVEGSDRAWDDSVAYMNDEYQTAAIGAKHDNLCIVIYMSLNGDRVDYQADELLAAMTQSLDHVAAAMEA